MDQLRKLRKLIWDPNVEVFTDEELREFLRDAGNNTYKAAALCLNIVRANPNKLKAFESFTYEDLSGAIEYYEKMAKGGAATTMELRKVY